MGNTTFAYIVTGLGTGSSVNCSAGINSSAPEHVNGTLTSNGTTRIDYIRVANASVARLNVTCWTRVGAIAGSAATNISIHLFGTYDNPLVNYVVTPAKNMSWVSSSYLTLNFSTNNSDALIANFNASSYLNCSLYLNTTYNATNSTTYPNVHDSSSFVLSTDKNYSGWWQLNFTCKDVAGNWGYNDSWFLGLDKAINASLTNYPLTNWTGKSGDVAFSAYFTDARNLSGYIFSSNHTGAWVNDSWTQLVAGAVIYFANYTNVTKTVSGGVLGTTFGWMVYANDSLGNWADTGIQQYVVTSVSTGGGTWIPTSTPVPTSSATPVPTSSAGTPVPTVLEIPTPTASGTPTETPTLPPVSGMTSSDAENEIAAAQSAVGSPVAGADVAAAQQELTLATQFMDEGDYDAAVQHAREALRLAQTAMPTATITPSVSVTPVTAGGGTNWLLYAGVILVLAGAGYYFFGRPKKGL